MPRHDGRAPTEHRPISFQRGFTNTAPGSVLAACGETRVLCTAVYTDGVPPWMKGKGRGWLTAEYAMHPASTPSRKPRDRAGKVDGRAVEIQRLIGRALRSVMAFDQMTERTIWIDCDVLQADGGTRTTSISGAYVALHDLLMHMQDRRILRGWPLKTQLAAISVGVVDGEAVCDLDYPEDSAAEVDMNLVMTGEGEFVEVQGSAEGKTFSRGMLDEMLALGQGGIESVFALQRQALEATST